MHSRLHAANYLLPRLHADCCLSVCCDLQILPVYRMCILRAAGYKSLVMPLHAAFCLTVRQHIAPYMYVASRVQSTVLRALPAACCLLLDALCPPHASCAKLLLLLLL